MRLIKLTMAGYRRFEKADINLDGDVLAIIGPNEAGKSTIFSALEALDHTEPIPWPDRTRGVEPPIVDEQVCIVARYLLDNDERALARDH